MSDHQILFREKLHNLSKKLSKTAHLLSGCIEGWQFAAFVDHHFLQTGTIAKKQPPDNRQFKVEPDTLSYLDDQISPQAYIDQIAAISDPRKQFEALVELAQTPTAALLADSFGSEVAAPAARNCMVIIGAGPVGLTLANALKRVFRDTVEILVVENRTSEEHRKQPYARQWLTNIPLEIVAGLIDDQVMPILKNVGEEGYTGLPINLYETLLLLSSKAIGVQFLFQKGQPDLSPWAPDLIFDASGGRWTDVNPPLTPVSPPKGIPGKTFNPPPGYDKWYVSFGIGEDNIRRRANLKIADDGMAYQPLINDQPIQVPMMKLTAIPFGIFDSLLAWVRQNNTDNKFYLWPGRLKASYNQAILLVNLTADEADFFREAVPGSPKRLRNHWPRVCEAAVVDERLKGFGRLVSEQLAQQGWQNEVLMERPFVYAPYFRHRPAPELVVGETKVPVVRIGDSIYNGHPKAGNGLGRHLAHVRRVVNQLVPMVELVNG